MTLLVVSWEGETCSFERASETLYIDGQGPAPVADKASEDTKHYLTFLFFQLFKLGGDLLVLCTVTENSGLVLHNELDYSGT